MTLVAADAIQLFVVIARKFLLHEVDADGLLYVTSARTLDAQQNVVEVYGYLLYGQTGLLCRSKTFDVVKESKVTCCVRTSELYCADEI